MAADMNAVFSDAISESPAFRKSLAEKEAASEQLDSWVKLLVREGNEMCRKGTAYSQKVEVFATQLQKCPDAGGEGMPLAQTMEKFGSALLAIEQQRLLLINNLEKELLKPLEAYRRETNEKTKDRCRSFKQVTRDYHGALDKSCSVKPATKAAKIEELDQELTSSKQAWISNALSYVQVEHTLVVKRRCTISELVCSAMKANLDFVDNTFRVFDRGLKGEYGKLCSWVAQENRDIQKWEGSSLRTMREAEAHATGAFKKAHTAVGGSDKGAARALVRHGGWLYVQKRTGFRAGLGSGWTRTWCRSNKSRFFAEPVDIVPADGVVVQSCCQLSRDVTDRRFCFEVNSAEMTIVCQASSDEDRRAWMVGLGSVFTPAKSERRKKSNLLEIERGFAFLKSCMAYVENKCIDDEGVYRTGGQKSKVLALYREAVKKNRATLLAEEDRITVTSCLKYFLREVLPEPVIPSGAKRQPWFKASNVEPNASRVAAFVKCIQDLPDSHRQILEAVLAHLRKISHNSTTNKMTASNLGVVFGPTLLWSADGADLSKISKCNTVVEHLIQDYRLLLPHFAATGDHEDEGASGGAVSKAAPPPTPPLESGKPSVTLAELPADVTTDGTGILPPPRPAPPTVRGTGGSADSVTGEYANVVGTQSSGEYADDTADGYTLAVATTVPRMRSSSDGSTFEGFPRVVRAGSRGGYQSDIRSGDSGIATKVAKFEETDAAAHAEEGYDNIIDGSLSIMKVPDASIESGSSDSAVVAVPPIATEPNPARFRALFDCVGGDDEELSFVAGDILLNVTMSDEDGWMEGTLERSGARGLFPQNYCVRANA